MFLERINLLHIKYSFFDIEHLFMLHINWLNHHKLLDVSVEIAQNLYNAYCMLKYVFADKDFDS